MIAVALLMLAPLLSNAAEATAPLLPPPALLAPEPPPASLPPAPPPGPALGRLEQESVDDALASLGLAVDPRRAGKRVGEIHIVNQEVFSRRDWWFQLLNIFHRTTRTEILRRELLFAPGQPYDQPLIDETIRNLQVPPTLVIANRPTFIPPELSSVVAIVPIVSTRPDTVDLLVVTRDLWSVRLNTGFEFQQNTITQLSTSISENNLFGWRKYLSFQFEMDQGRAGIGPTYFDPNIAGTRLTLLASAIAWYARDDRAYEGNTEQFSLRYPLYSLASRWGAGVDVAHQDAVLRSFRGNQLRLTDLAGTPAVEQLPYVYRRKILAVDVNVVRAFGVTVIQRVTFGHRVDSRRSEVLPDFPADPANPQLAQLFLSQVAAQSETRSEPYLRYDLLTPRYLVIRDLDTFDLRENRRLGPSLSLEVAYGSPALGADFLAFPVSARAAWAIAPGGGYAALSIAGSARLRRQGAIDRRAGADLFIATPLVGRAGRLVLRAQTDLVRADTNRTPYFLGGSTGLRGYVIGDFEGTTQVIAHAEFRSTPLAVFSQRFGALLFYDVGHAAPSFSQLVPYHDFGLGLRWLIPQLNSSVLRFDWAFATQSTSLTRAGFPGRFSAGFFQAF